MKSTIGIARLKRKGKPDVLACAGDCKRKYGDLIMKALIAAALAAGVAMAGASAADARDGCGPGFHRGYYGHCRPNDGPRAYAVGRQSWWWTISILAEDIGTVTVIGSVVNATTTAGATASSRREAATEPDQKWPGFFV